MALPPDDFIVTSVVAGLRDFLNRPGVRHALLVGPGGAGKTAALAYLEASLRAENHLVVIVQISEINTGDQLAVSIVRAVLKQSEAQSSPAQLDALNRIAISSRSSSQSRKDSRGRRRWWNGSFN